MRSKSLFFVVSAISLTIGVGCEPAPVESDVPDSYRSVLPDDRVKVQLDTDYSGSRDLGQLADAYVQTAQITNDVNGFIGGVLDHVDNATDYPPAWTSTEEATAVWGPYGDDTDPSEVALMVGYDEATDIYTWVIALRERGSIEWDDFEPFVVGQVEENATEEDSNGWFYLDFDVVAAHGMGDGAQGRFVTEYDVNPDGSAEAAAGFEDFVPQGEDQAINAFYKYSNAADGSGAMDLVYEGDVDGDPTSAKETHAVRTRWMADGSGRGDAGVGGGDLGDFVGWQSECWGAGPDFGRTFYANNWDMESIEGDREACVFTDEDFSDDADVPE